MGCLHNEYRERHHFNIITCCCFNFHINIFMEKGQKTQHHKKKEVKSISLTADEEWDIAPKYALEQRLGDGTYGSVCKAVCLETN